MRSQAISMGSALLSFFAILMILLTILALLDIAQDREPDLSGEWAVVWYSIPIILLSQVVSVAAIIHLWKRLQEEMAMSVESDLKKHRDD
jgi:hypothetical protein